MARLSLCVTFAMVAVSGAAEAQHARYPRSQPTPQAVDFSDRVKPLVPTPAANPQAATKPSINADAVMSIDGLRGNIRSEQEQILVQLIQNTPDSEPEEKSDYYFRLGELYAKQQRFWRDKTVEMAAAGKQNETAQAANRAKEYLLKTVKTYKGLTDNDAFRNYPKMDLALFYYGYTLQSGKYMKEARAVYDKLLKNYPQSKFVPEAHLAFAEYYADAGQLADAEARYKAVLQFPKSSIYPYALYRMGWIYLQLQKPQDAIEYFSKAMRETRNDKKQEAVYQAAKADFARTYAASGTHPPSFASFAKSPEGTALLDVVADATWSEGSPERVLAAYRELASRAPSDVRACEWQYRIARAALSAPNSTYASTVKEVSALVRLQSKSDSDECRANAAAMSGELAATFFADWSVSQIPESLDAAEQLYALHASVAPDDVEVQAQYGELLWTRADRESNTKVRLEKWRKAAEVFGGISTAEAKRAAALAWMNAQDIALPDAKLALSKAPRTAPKPQRVSANDAKLLAAITAATTGDDIASDEEELGQMQLAAAITWRKYRHFDEAVTLLDAFLEKHPESVHAEVVAILLLDSMIQRGKPDETAAVVEAIAGDVDFLDGKLDLFRNLQLLRARTLRAAR